MQKMEDKKRRNKSDYGEDFVAPDGGWGWLVSIAAGVSFVTAIGFVQTFGLLFRDRMQQIGLVNSQITAIGNTQVALCSCIGLFNGPLFRRFSYRQIGIFGSILSTIGIFQTAFASSFITFFFPYSILFGFGMGFVLSAANLALNTYFKKRRPTSSSIAWAIAGLGPVLLPLVIALVLPMYGYRGTMLLFSLFTLHSLPSALIFQPVLWHVKKSKDLKEQDEKLLGNTLCKENFDKDKINENSNENNNENMNEDKLMPLIRSETCQHHKTQKEKNCKKKSNSLCLSDDTHSIKSFFVSTEDLVQLNYHKSHEHVVFSQKPNVEPKSISWTKKIITYFDLDLFRDLTYINLMIGLTLTAFSEVNIALLTPFFLSEFGFNIKQITVIMSCLGITDLVIRLLTSFISSKLNWSGTSFYIFGIFVMVFARCIIAIAPSFEIVLAMFILMGTGKAWRTIFLNLVIACHIDLKRLPAAQGLQLMTQGIFILACGPLVGLIRDATNYTMTIYILNLISIVPMLSWIIEIMCIKYRNKAKHLDNTEV